MSDDFPLSPDLEDDERQVCAHCGLPRPGSTEENQSTDPDEYCSDLCRDTSDEQATGLTDYDDATFFNTGVTAIDSSLPQGMPRNTVSVLSGEAGTRLETILVELAWRALERGEPVVLVTISDPPLTLLRQFLTLKWNIIPYLETGDLQVVDCYSYRSTDDHDVVCSEWDAHLQAAIERGNAVRTVRDPSQPEQIQRHLRKTADALAMDCRGLILIDSLTELGTLVRSVQGYEFVKNLRADYCKARNVAVFCGAHYSGNADEFPHEMQYLFDGLFDLSLNPNVIPNILLKEFTVRKMRGVMSIRERHPFEYMEHEGMMLVQPSQESNADDAEAPPDADDTETRAQ